jgi:hypothetical protein
MATSSGDISSLRRQMLAAAGTISAMFGPLLTEYGRAAAATRRYDELKRTGPVMLLPIEAASSIPRAIFEEFYGGRWRPAARGKQTKLSADEQSWPRATASAMRAH